MRRRRKKSKKQELEAELLRERMEAVRTNRMRSQVLLAEARSELIERALVEEQAAFLLIATRQKIWKFRELAAIAMCTR